MLTRYKFWHQEFDMLRPLRSAVAVGSTSEGKEKEPMK